MVAIAPPAKVLVTGANGYLAGWVVKKYLEEGYSVRGTVRSLIKSAFLLDKFSSYGDRFELVVVEDITKDGAFDEAVKGVDVIAHTASPFNFKTANPDGMILSLLKMFALFQKFAERDILRSDHPCRAGHHIDPELRSKTREHREASYSHLFGRRCLRNRHRAARFHREQLEYLLRRGREDQGLRGGASCDLFCVKDAGREGRVGVCGCSQV